MNINRFRIGGLLRPLLQGSEICVNKTPMQYSHQGARWLGCLKGYCNSGLHNMAQKTHLVLIRGPCNKDQKEDCDLAKGVRMAK